MNFDGPVYEQPEIDISLLWHMMINPILYGRETRDVTLPNAFQEFLENYSVAFFRFSLGCEGKGRKNPKQTEKHILGGARTKTVSDITCIIFLLECLTVPKKNNIRIPVGKISTLSKK